jgi:hypothetical protein
LRYNVNIGLTVRLQPLYFAGVVLGKVLNVIQNEENNTISFSCSFNVEL